MGKQELTVELELSPDRPVRVAIESAVTGPALIAGAKLGLRPALADDAHRAGGRRWPPAADAVVVVVGTDGDWETEGARPRVDGPARRRRTSWSRGSSTWPPTRWSW